MFEQGRYIEVYCDGNWVVCRVSKVIGDMIHASREDGFTWLGVRFFARNI